MTDYKWIENYMTKPFKELAYGPDEFDCYGLVHHVCLNHGGITLPRFDDIEYQLTRINATINQQAAADCWEQVREPREFDVAVMQRAGEALHVGVFLAVDGGKILHATRKGTYCSDMGGIYRMLYRRVMFYRFNPEGYALAC
jgi:cell wall-associated NlpC family hydrolase